MRYAFALFVFFLATLPVVGQKITLGDSVPSGAVDAAKQLLKDAAPKTLALNVGEFEVVEPSASLKSPLLWLPINEDLVQRIEIAANQPFAIWMIRRGDKAPKLHQFQPQPVSWCLLVGVKDGKSSIFVIRNGDATTAPQVADRLDVTVGKPQPDPPGPLPPQPDPPGPNPPIPSEGFRVLFVYESKDLSTLPSAQVQAMTAKEVLDYLDSHCVKVNGQPEYRKFDKDVDLSKASQFWKDGMARPRQSLPWIVMTNGKTGYEGPLPANTAELMKLLKTYGGP